MFKNIVLGDCGDCGNFAIAFQECFGGTLVGIFDSDILEHVLVRMMGYYYDAHGFQEDLYIILDHAYEIWADETDADSDPDIKYGEIDSEYIFEHLEKTNRGRIGDIKKLIHNIENIKIIWEMKHYDGEITTNALCEFLTERKRKENNNRSGYMIYDSKKM